MVKNPPLVSVVTPVYNGAQFIVECIESVLSQDYPNWEYHIVNNCSTDSTLDIAARYSEKDKRIRIHSFESFVGVIENHNRAVRLISPNSKYCKVLSADDWLLPECITRLVDVAEANPSVGIVGSYQLWGSSTKWSLAFGGLPYKNRVVSGREICRWHLFGGPFVFGCPTSVLYRSELIREAGSFYPNSREQADTSVCYKILKSTDFGFVHQVLSCQRVHEGALSTEAFRIGTHLGSSVIDHFEYGPYYLTRDEQQNRLKKILNEYYEFLAVGIIHFRDTKFWNYHKQVLRELRLPFYCIRLLKALFIKCLDLFFNPMESVEKLTRHIRNNSKDGRRKSREVGRPLALDQADQPGA